MDVLEFWNRIKRLIKEQNTTQDWVSDKIGVSYRTFHNWIYNKRLPDAFQIQRIAETLGVSVEYLVGAKVPDFEIGLSQDALFLAHGYEKLTDEGKKAARVVIEGLQGAFPREKVPVPQKEKTALPGPQKRNMDYTRMKPL